MYAVSLDRWLGIMDEKFVIDRVRRHTSRGGGTPQQAPARPAGPAYDPSDPGTVIEWETLKLAVQRPALLGPVFDALPPEVFTAPAHGLVREVIEAAGGVVAGGARSGWAQALREAAPNDEVKGPGHAPCGRAATH